MKIRRFLAFAFLVALLAVTGSSGQEQEQGKSDRHDGRGLRDGGRIAAGEKGMLREGFGGMATGENGMQEAILARILNNPKAASEIGLSAEQIDILKASQEEMKKQHEQFQQQLKDSGVEQAKLMTGESVDEGAIMTAVEKAGKIKIEMAKSRMRYMLLVKKILTPDQVKKIKEMVQKHVKQVRGEGDKKDKDGEAGKDRREHSKKKLQENKDGI